MDAEELGVLGSALAGGRDWSSIKRRGAVNVCPLASAVGWREGKPPSKSPPIQARAPARAGVRRMRPPCLITFSPGITSSSYRPQEIGQSWKPLGFLRHPSRETTCPVPRLARGCGSWRQRRDAVGLVGCLPPQHHPGESGMPGARSLVTHRAQCNQLGAMHWAQHGLILPWVSLWGCAVPGLRKS